MSADLITHSSQLCDIVGKMEQRGTVVLSSNWNTLGNIDLHCILIEDSLDSLTIDVEALTVDSCVCLVQNNGNETSKAELEIKTFNGNIRNFILLSEAQVIEVFGVNDEYLFTNMGEFFDDWEEMAVYCSKISLPSIPVCKLKFTRTKCENRIWLYGAKIVVQNIKEECQSPIQFNIEQIKRLLTSSNTSRINSESSFRNLLELNFKNRPNNLGYLMGNSDCSNHILEIVGSDNGPRNCLTEMLSKWSIKKQKSDETEKSNLPEVAGETFNNNLYFSYIDNKLHEMKHDILHEIDIKINNLREETNKKLDKIISLLENEGIQT